MRFNSLNRLTLYSFATLCMSQILFILPSCAQRSPKEAKQAELTSKARGSYSIGDTVKDFSLLNYDGKRVSIHDYSKARGLVIVFMRNTCEYCQAYETRILDLSKKYKSLGYPLIAISPFGDDYKDHPLDVLPKMKELAVKKHFDFPYLSDEKLKMTNLFDDQYTPTTYILENKKGSMIMIYKGDIDDDWENNNPHRQNFIQQKLDSLLKKR